VVHTENVGAAFGAVPAVIADELAALMVGKDRETLVFTDMRGGVLRNSNWAGAGISASGAEMPNR
jgi:hypothetical protein